MASIDDIDAEAIVRKYLERKVVVDREDEAADSADEITAVLEATALSFLLFPQAALTFVLRAKNILQQILDADLALLDYMLKAIDDVQNPNEPIEDTSDLLEAQSALVEVDRIGRISDEVRAYDRYTSAVDRFLERQLGKALKRRKRGEFERSGPEAKQDLFRILSAYLPAHTIMASRLETLRSSLDNFQSVDLTRLVATKTVSKVRASLQKIQTGLQRGDVSKVSVAIELLSGAAALRSISNGRTLFDPLVETDEFPDARAIYAYSEPVAAVATGTSDTVDLFSEFPTPPQIFEFVVNQDDPEGSISNTATFPEGIYIASKRADDTELYVIPSSDRTLFVQLDGPEAEEGQTIFVQAIALTEGTWTAAEIAAEIDAALQPNASCSEWNNSGRLIIEGIDPTTRISIRDTYLGSFDGSFVYSEPDGSIHETLGFTNGQESAEAGIITPIALLEVLEVYSSGVELSLDADGAPVIRSASDAITSSLIFEEGVPELFGFSGSIFAQPGYLVLKEKGVEIDPSSLGVIVGSVVRVVDPLDASKSLRDPISRIDGTQLYFDVDVARADGEEVVILTPLVDAAQAVVEAVRPFVGTFEDDARAINRVLSPLISTPTLAQINDATNELSDLRDRVDSLRSLLADIIVQDDRNEFLEIAKNIIAGLEERGLDRAIELLSKADFSAFFGLTNETASKSSRLMKATEELVRNELPIPTRDDETPEVTAVGTNEDLRVPNEELNEDIF